jgi:adenosylcobinamide kinase / adenosylcobinamide-phosphate guanylyltransferase
VARIVVVTGGSRSGKSSYAQRLGESLPGPRTYLATAPVIDDEFRRRIEAHREARAGADWATLEETTSLAEAIRLCRASAVVLVECLTLWINNLMYEAQQAGRAVDERQMALACRDVLAACRAHPGTVIFVTNEVGMGIVPADGVSRLYRDLVGRCNQTIAAEADQVTFVCCGIPLHVKKPQ